MSRNLGDTVYVRSLFGASYWSGTIVKVRQGIFGKKYLVHYKVHDSDFDYHYSKMSWYREWRLV